MLNGEVYQELINGNHWRHISVCTRHQSDHSHGEIEIYHVCLHVETSKSRLKH